MTKDQPKIWCSMAWGDPRSSRPVKYDTRGMTSEDLYPIIAQNDLFNVGQAVDPVAFPGPVFLDRSRMQEKDKSTIPDFFKMRGGWTLISERFKSVLDQFDLGATKLNSITVHDFDRVTPLPEKFFLLNVTEIKDGFDLERTEGNTQQLKDRWSLWENARPAVRAHVGEGVDLWIDRHVFKSYFLSDRLAQALKAEKISGLRLKKCVVAD